MKLTIETDNVYLALFKHLNIESDWKLKTKELIALADLYLNNFRLFKTIKDKAKRMSILLSKKSKEKMAMDLGINYASYMNTLSKFRKLGLLKDNILDNRFEINIENPVELKLVITHKQASDV